MFEDELKGIDKELINKTELKFNSEDEKIKEFFDTFFRW